MPYAKFDFGRLFYEAREGRGRPLLFLHGNLGCTLWWKKLFAVLPGEWPLYAMDFPGCGNSDQSKKGYSIEELARSVQAFIHSFKWRKVDVVGHSMGGIIALQLGLIAPERVSRLMLVDPAPADGLQFTPEMAEILAQMGTGREGIRKGFMTAAPTIDPDPFFESLVDKALLTDFRFVVEAAQWIQHVDLIPRLTDLQIPVLVLWGEKDPVIALEDLKRTSSAIKNSKLVVLDGIGHCAPIEAPDILAEHLVSFRREGEPYFEF